MHQEKLKKVLLKVLAIPLGILGLVLFRWTPATGKGLAIYGVLLIVLIVAMLILGSRKHQGYWPDPPK